MIKFLIAFAFSLILVACGHEPDIASGHKIIGADADSISISLRGNVSLEPPLNLRSLDIYAVDEDLHVIDTLSVLVREKASREYVFTTRYYSGTTSLLRADYTCQGKDSTSILKLTEYVDVAVDSQPTFALHNAIISGRIKNFVRNEGFYLALAKRKARRELRSLFGVEKDDDRLMYWLPYVYAMGADTEKKFNSIIKNFMEALGTEKRWDDIVDPVFVADSLVQISILGEEYDYGTNYGFYDAIWQKTYGFHECDSTSFGSSLRNKNKESKLYDEDFVCQNQWQWVRDSIPVSTGDSAASDAPADSLNGDSLGFVDLTSSYVDSVLGGCVSDRDGEKGRIGLGYYICMDSIWKPIDRVTYFLGVCDSAKYVQGYYKSKVFEQHDSVGYYFCTDDEWTKVTPPQYYQEKCTDGKMVVYDSVYYTCENSVWRYSKATELERVYNGILCDNNTKGMRVDYSHTQYYLCMDDKWELLEYYDEELILRDALKRNGKDPHYCDNGVGGVSPIWLPEDSMLVTCSNLESTYKYYDVVLVVSEPYFDDSIMATGTLSQSYYDFYLTIVKDGVEYIFKQGGGRYSYGNRTRQNATLGLRNIVVGDVKYNTTELNGFYFAALAQDASVNTDLNKVENRSESFDDFFAGWLADVEKLNSCYPWILKGCEETYENNEVKSVTLKGEVEDSYLTWENAKNKCPPGYHIPDTTEWKTQKYFVQGQYRLIDYPVTENFVGGSVTYDIFWSSEEKDNKTHFCYEQAWFKSVGQLESRIIECPKDLFPLVQLMCVRD